MSESISLIVLIILYLANFVFLLRFLSAVATKTVFKGVEAVYSIIFLILIYGTINYFNLKLFLITLVSALVIFGIIRINTDKLGMRMAIHVQDPYTSTVYTGYHGTYGYINNSGYAVHGY